MKIAALLVAVVCLLPTTAFSQVAASRLERIIVEFVDEAPFEAFALDYREDERTRQAPHVFAYQRRSVVGLVMAMERRDGFRAHAFYSHALRGFAASVTRAQRAALAADPLVKRIDDDPLIRLAPITPAAQTIPWGIPKVGADISSTQSGDGSGTVTGVNVYVIDTGIDVTHPDLNVVGHLTFVPNEPNADCNGHGTAVAGLIGARDNADFIVGVAPGVPLTGLKVLSCAGFGFPSNIVQAVDWVTANAVRPAVANMSVGSALPNPSVNTAVRNSAASGIFYAVAAGNGNPFTGQGVNACLSSPAGAGLNLFGIPNGIVTAAATDMADMEADFSNFGVCVNLWAPGVDLTSTYLMSLGGTLTASGTSFSSPMVAGGAALLLSQEPTLAPWLVELILQAVAETPGTVSKDGAPIRRLFVAPF
jgi:subtilisin family serine protease